MQRELERDTRREREKKKKKLLRCLSAQGQALEESHHVGTDSGKEKIAEKVLTKNEKPKLVLVEYYVFDGQFACYRNSREKGEKKTLVSLQQKHPIFREQNQL
jgi:hypothetical protein